jgi:hypothetical protein
MGTFTQEEFLRLIEYLNDNQYGSEEDSLDNEEEAWLSAMPIPPKKKKPPENSGTQDLTNLKKDKIKDAIYKSTNLKIDKFTIKVNKYHGFPDKNGKATDLFVDLSFWQDVTKTPNGAPCKMTYKLDVLKDNRFASCPWINYCSGTSATKVPIDMAVEIVRWFQGIIRMTAFL